MSIHLTCRSCGANIKAPDHGVSRKGKCPKCGSLLSIPAAKPAPFPLPPAVQSHAARNSPLPIIEKGVEDEEDNATEALIPMVLPADPEIVLSAEAAPRRQRSADPPKQGHYSPPKKSAKKRGTIPPWVWFLGIPALPAILFILCCGGFTSISKLSKWSEVKAIKQADQLYEEGNRDQAVDIYKQHFSKARAENKGEILKRIVEREVEKGDTAEATKWIEEGLDEKVNAGYATGAARGLLAKVEKDREERSVKKATEEARLAEEAARKIAEAERQRKAEGEEEHDAHGLVLLLKTVKGTRGEFGGEITGTVVNRRAHKLGYAQITFNLYDQSGAQVGSALANINGLEPGGRWNFKASTFGNNWTRYKFSELSGF